MQKAIITFVICLLVLQVRADDRTLTGEYWIDDGYTTPTTMSIGSDGVMKFSLDASALKEGLHALYYRAKDSEGMYSPLQSWLFYRQHLGKEKANKVTALEYWTDNRNDLMKRQSVSSEEIQFTLDLSALKEGLHSLSYHTQDDQGYFSPTQQWLFFRYVNEQAGDCVLEHWIDESEHYTHNVNETDIAFVLDASVVEEGLHTLHYRLLTQSGQIGSEGTWLFYRVPPAYEGDNRTLEYWIDEGEHQTRNANEADIAFVLDASTIEEGLHTLNYQLKEEGGHVSPQHQWMFYRVSPANGGGNRTLEYWIDEGEHQTRNANETDIAFVLDASTIEEGLHTLNYQLKEEGGRVSPQQQWMFYRVAPKSDGQRITWYRIWWNDHQDKAVEVQMPDGGTEFLYEQTLAVPEYARNDGYTRDYTARFHIVFGDDAGGISPMETAVVAYPDIYPPVTTLKVTKDGDNIRLSWESNEDGVRDYNVYYSENDEPYVLWKPNIIQQEATFRGQKGIVYRFMVTARDVNGNYEAMDADKTVKVEF